MGHGDVGFTGVKDISTPNIDRIAHGGVRFTSGYVSHPFCSPTRAGLMTGRYQQRFGHENNPRYDPSDHVAGLPAGEVTLPQVLGEAGYATGIVGKWHLGAAPEMHPLRRGFREQFGFIGGGHDYFKAGEADEKREYFIPFERNGRPAAESEYLTDALSREAAAFVRRHAQDPFFLYLAYNAPHTPQQVSDRYLDRFAGVEPKMRRLYNAMVSAVDDGVGKLLDTVAELKLDQDTLVIFLSDNGGPVGINGSSNAPLRGAKGGLYEGGIRVPFAARWSGRLAAGKTYSEPVISLDIFPTAAALAGAKTPAGVKLDGVDLMPHLTGAVKRPPHERLFWRTGGGVQYAVREGRYKLFRNAEGAELYDLEADIGETRDLAAERKDVFERLDRARQAWDRELIPPRFQSPQPAGGKKKK
ncbi:MAG: sulfatase-like hydrolase/transferase [Acidobacteria bacterium]|nr:sulfatase-like hydrolase/transferase [Acidobacteriota bacterium]